MNRIAIYLTALAAAPAICFAAFALSATNIPMGQIDLSSGSQSLGQVDPDAIGTSGANAIGTIKNAFDPALPWSDMTITVSGGSPDSVTFNGETLMNDPVGSNRWHLSPLEENIDGTDVVSFSVNGLEGSHGSGGGGKACLASEMLEITGTPSVGVSINGGSVHGNAFPVFNLSTSRDHQRGTITQMDHAVGIAHFKNNDPVKRVNQIEGVLSVVSPSLRSLVDVELQDTSGSVIPSTVTFSGNSFTMTGFPAITAGQSRYVVVELSDSVDEPTIRLRLTGTFVN